MKVIVNNPGFYGGVWHDAGRKPVEIADAVARQFLPPYGSALAVAPAGEGAGKPSAKAGGSKDK